MARIPLAYNLRNLAARRLSTGLTALGIALVAGSAVSWAILR
jgi:hypothetical protein